MIIITMFRVFLPQYSFITLSTEYFNRQRDEEGAVYLVNTICVRGQVHGNS